MAKVSFHFVRGKDLEKFASTLVNFTGKVSCLLIPVVSHKFEHELLWLDFTTLPCLFSLLDELSFLYASSK